MPVSPTKTKQPCFLFDTAVVLTGALLVLAIHLIFLRAPLERTMGIVQKVFYFHVPSAYGMYMGALACLIGSIGYFLQPGDRWDALGRAGAEMAVLFGAIVLTTGPLWAAKAWGYYWTWDPRLTTSLLSTLLYLAYLILRAFTTAGQAERQLAAVLGILGATNLPIIHFSVQKWSGQHPTVLTAKGGGLHHPAMKLALATSFLAFTLLALILLWFRSQLEQLKSQASRVEEHIADVRMESSS